ncbi:acyltransferase [Arthrobacter sp. KBS0703]|uniref:acyltransferase family protein n=1 Tax=Arthrobacter sp. KBS0703 TaxID=1955698 RepID=UPI00098E8C47|nr:acyltransferase [Arthrobacter sp. KBS0703]TSE14732.1 acyltransferase [Arthrobacter sp. KBS0703]
MDDKPTRLDSLTGLRFLAAILVVSYHASVTLVPEMFPLVSVGQTGVTFFFVLSGFVLAWSMKPNTPKAQFYWRRFARVWPLHALTLVAAVVLNQATQGEQSVPRFIAALLLLQSWHADPTWVYAYNGVSWSLSCEAFFYAVFPFLAVWLSRFRAKRLLPICVLVFVAAALLSALLPLVPAFDWGALLYTFPAYRVSEFVVGVCLAMAFRKGWKPRFGVWVGAAAAVGPVLLLEVVAANVPWHIAPALASTLCMPGFALLIAAFAHRDCTGGRRTFASSPAMVRLGEWSFALYLVHELVLRTALELGPVTLGERAAFAAAGVAVSIMLSALLFTLFERPIEARLRGMFLRGGPAPNSPQPEESLVAK